MSKPHGQRLPQPSVYGLLTSGYQLRDIMIEISEDELHELVLRIVLRVLEEYTLSLSPMTAPGEGS